MAREDYAAQVRLMLKILPAIGKERLFALKGGTAINLFYRDLPRLSADIDLTYIPIQSREESLSGINAAMNRIMEKLEKIPGISCQRIKGGGGNETRVLVRQGASTVKVETSPVTRGVVFEPQVERVQPSVEREFGFAEATLVSFEDAYGGKLHAALSRQHPRDIFDVHLLYENEGLSDVLFRVFLVYLSCSSRPMHELLNPNLLDISDSYEKEFVGMTVQSKELTLDELYMTRKMLIDDIQSRLVGNASDYLMSLQRSDPDFSLLNLSDNLESLPAIQWKLLNLRRLISGNPQKHESQTMELERLLQ
jgi:predicted nucleotidyltransferase component of viral defense system